MAEAVSPKPVREDQFHASSSFWHRWTSVALNPYPYLPWAYVFIFLFQRHQTLGSGPSPLLHDLIPTDALTMILSLKKFLLCGSWLTCGGEGTLFNPHKESSRREIEDGGPRFTLSHRAFCHLQNEDQWHLPYELNH